MKKAFLSSLCLSLLLLPAIVIHAQNALRIDFSGANDKITFEKVGIENTTHHLSGISSRCGWLKSAANYSYYAKVNLVPGTTQVVTLRFTPKKSGRVRLTLRGIQEESPGLIAYRRINAAGAKLDNSTFDQLDSAGRPLSWKTGHSSLPPGSVGVKKDPALFSGGGNYLVCSHDGCYSQDFPVIAEKEVVIAAEVRLVADVNEKSGPFQRFVRIDPGSPELKGYNREWRFFYPYTQRTESENASKPPRYLNRAPWQGTYKKKAAVGTNDFPGPDGLIYPDFSRAGLSKEWKEPRLTLPLADFGAKPGTDITAALEAAVAQASTKGGAVITIGPGTFTYSRPIIIRSSNIVICGSGSEGPGSTVLEFDYALKPYEVRFYRPSVSGEEFGPEDRLCIHANLNFPLQGKQTSTLELLVDGRPVAEKKSQRLLQGQFENFIRCGNAMEKIGAGAGVHRISARVTWRDGRSETVTGPEFVYRPDKLHDQGNGHISASGSIIFEGRCPYPTTGTGSVYPGGKWKLARDAAAGSNVVEFTVEPAGLKPGAMLYLSAVSDPKWMQMLNTTTSINTCRVAVVNVKAVRGKTVHLAEPLRIDFPAAAPTSGTEIIPVENSGLRDLCLKTVKPIWVHSALFKFARNCLVSNLRVEKAGRNAIEFKISKNCEIRRVTINDAWFKDGGGTAYFGWETCFDCLAQDIKTTHLRHAPNFQFGSSGCVISGGTFLDSDLQLHAGWPSENLVENCTVVSRQTDGSYGFGIFITGPQSTIHGPQGPRNVFYRNNINSVKAGVWLGGSNEGYIFAYNRFTTFSGPAVLAHLGSFDHTFIGNRFTLFNPKPGAVMLATPDCTGNDFVDNVFQGPISTLWVGAIPPAIDRDNRIIPLSAQLPEVKAPVESLYRWQKEQRAKRKEKE